MRYKKEYLHLVVNITLGFIHLDNVRTAIVAATEGETQGLVDVHL